MFGWFKKRSNRLKEVGSKKRIPFEIKPRITFEIEMEQTKLDILQEAIREEKKKRIPKARRIKLGA